jgi:hypothetical protein
VPPLLMVRLCMPAAMIATVRIAPLPWSRKPKCSGSPRNCYQGSTRITDGLHDAVEPARFEAGRDRGEPHEAVNQQAGADQEDERHRDCLATSSVRNRSP